MTSRSVDSKFEGSWDGMNDKSCFTLGPLRSTFGSASFWLVFGSRSKLWNSKNPDFRKRIQFLVHISNVAFPVPTAPSSQLVNTVSFSPISPQISHSWISPFSGPVAFSSCPANVLYGETNWKLKFIFWQNESSKFRFSNISVNTRVQNLNEIIHTHRCKRTKIGNVRDYRAWDRFGFEWFYTYSCIRDTRVFCRFFSELSAAYK